MRRPSLAVSLLVLGVVLLVVVAVQAQEQSPVEKRRVGVRIPYILQTHASSVPDLLAAEKRRVGLHMPYMIYTTGQQSKKSSAPEDDVWSMSCNLREKTATGKMVSDSPDRTLTSSSVVASPPGRLSPNTLTAKLIELREDIANGGVENVELQKFEADEGVSMEEFEQMRDKVRAQVKDQALFEEKTKLKLSGAAVAGAKLLVDETHTTRTMTKKLVLESGIDEEDVLYKGLPPVGTERRVARQMAEERNASVLESFVDFQRQVDFKARLVRLVDANVRKQPFGLSRSDGKAMLAIRERELRHCREAKPSKSTIDHRHPQKETCAAAAASPPPRPRKNRGRGCAARKGKKGDTKEGEDDQRTPKRRVAFNALDGDKIIEKYALEVASDIVDQAQSRRRRRHIAPIPFRIDLMDEYSSEEEINSQAKKKTKEEEEEAATAKEREIDSGDAPSLPPTEKRRRVPTIES